MKIVWTKHAEDRQGEWEKKLRITRQEVENVVRSPEQVVKGDREILVAQAKIHNGVLRVPFMQVGENKKIITIYWTSRVERYWRGEKDENKI